MTVAALRPVGEPAPPPVRVSPITDLVPEGYECHFVQSGTAALGLALRLIVRSTPPPRRRVLLPAYACPDLLAAVVFAGCEAVLIDTEAGSPFLSVDALRRLLDDRVAAVIGAHFLGVREQVETIASLVESAGAVFVEDSAQCVPNRDASAHSPLVVLSFGRGKPAGALGGGALLIEQGSYRLGAGDVEEATASSPTAGLMRWLYNAAIAPVPYAMLSKLPFLQIGETHYRPLETVRRLDTYRKGVGITRWRQPASGSDDVVSRYTDMFARTDYLTPLEVLNSAERWTQLLRFPVLCDDRARRDRLHAALSRRGLGSSVMYGRSLADLPGMPPVLRGEPANARDFADRLLTLPTHSAVREKHLARIARLVDEHEFRQLADD